VKISFTPGGWDDYLYWQHADPKLLARINALLQDMPRSPFRGIGKPEPLRENWAGWWSRRIDGEHRGLSGLRIGRRAAAGDRSVPSSLLRARFRDG
jgi:toxin YoeB